MKRMGGRMERVLNWMDDNVVIAAMRRGLVLAIPFIMIGSFSIVLSSFPVPAYQSFIKNALDGALLEMLTWLNEATLGSFSLVLIIAISSSYSKKVDGGRRSLYILTSLCCYILFTAKRGAPLSFDVFDSTWIFSAIVVTVLSCMLLYKLFSITKSLNARQYKEGTDLSFQSTVMAIPSVTITVLAAMAAKFLCMGLFGGTDIQNFGSEICLQLFQKIGSGFGGAVVFIILIHALWFFGIHGSNMLGAVSVTLFESGIAVNAGLLASGLAPTEIFSKTFIDSFILMGGSGATICLLISLLIVSRRQNNKRLIKLSVVPAIFNINEMVLFGLPLVFNPIMIIPFVLVPLVLLITSGLAMYIGWVPLAVHQVKWTTPVIFSGILSTGSWKGGVLQLFNIALGVLLYLPFIRLSETYHTRILKNNVNALTQKVIDGEQSGASVNLFEGDSRIAEVAKMLTSDLCHAIENDKLELYYQPQVCSDGTVFGAEALLRWDHPVSGFLYPPLVVELAREEGLLDQMGLKLIERSCVALQELAKKTIEPMKLSVNISPIQLEDPEFCTHVKELLTRYDFGSSTLYFEITEQIALSCTAVIAQRINELREAGIPFIMDDFGMGHSSMLYLQNNEFASVKLDGSLVKQVLENKRSENIIGGIRYLSNSLGCSLIAEYVETKEQRDRLKEIGCEIYQGYYFGKAMPLVEFEGFLREYHAMK